MIVEFKIKTSVFRAVLECAKWQANHLATDWQNYQTDQWVEVTDDGHLRYDGRRHALWRDSAVDMVIYPLCTAQGGTLVARWLEEHNANPTEAGRVMDYFGKRERQWFRDLEVVDYETSDERLQWWETADDHDRSEYWAQYAADTLRCESGGSRSRRHR
jgi:hypothetical protein